jgi:hypothetical protein
VNALGIQLPLNAGNGEALVGETGNLRQLLSNDIRFSTDCPATRRLNRAFELSM